MDKRYQVRPTPVPSNGDRRAVVPTPLAPLLPAAVTAALGTLAAVLGFAAGVVIAPLSWVLALAAMLCALFAGLAGFQVPRFTVGSPLVKASLIGPLTTGAAILVDHATTLPEGYVRAALLTLAVLCVGLAGVPLPVPGAGGGR